MDNQKTRDISGFILIDKPSGPTSHDVVDALRRVLGIRKIGHAGTLDPFASGLLILAIGKATKEISKFVGLDKTYEADIRLGAVSDTMDRTGQITGVECASPDIAEVKNVLAKFIGGQEQVPPMFSAKKVGGRKLYELARAGETVVRQPVKVTIHEIELLSYEWPILKIRTRVSSGTYIRALAHDIGAALGCGAYLEELRRMTIGEFKVEDALKTNELSSEAIETRLFR